MSIPIPASTLPGYLDASTLSPDPLDLRRGRALPNGGIGLEVYPAKCLLAEPRTADVRRWGDALAWDCRPEPVMLKANSGRGDILLDFATELEATLEVVCSVPSSSWRGGLENRDEFGRRRSPFKSCNLYVSFGESVPEAMTWGLPTQNPLQTYEWRVEGATAQRRVFDARGFRFVRLQLYDAPAGLMLHRIVAHAWFALPRHVGGFACSDRRFQRVWQASAYTARLCTRRDAYWDGPKRDRGGWYGDARVIQETTDALWLDPAPAAAMLPKLSVDQWTNSIPGFSFDAVAMLRQFILAHGLDHPAVRETYGRVRRFLDWVRRTQVNRDGFIIRDPKASFFGNVAFVDWSAMPVGGKFEELSWLQCKHAEALRNAAWIAARLRRRADARHFTDHAERLSRKILRVFWRPGEGLVHTLNQTTKQWEWLRILLPLGGERYRKLYFENKPIGPSGASRHSMTLAAWAGVLDSTAHRREALRVFASTKLDPIVTPYFLYYEQAARATLGEPAAAIMAMRDFVGQQLEMHNSSTVWEWYEPWINDIRAMRLGDWPKSLCHGWGSGAVPLAMRHLLGVRAVEPGYGVVRLAADANLPWSFDATIPTPHGMIQVHKATARGRVEYTLPRGVEAARDPSA